MNPEIYSHLFPLVFKEGALDFYLTNIIMKKNRPGIKLSLLCHKKNVKKFEEILFRETTTLGIRKYNLDREKLTRKFVKVDSQFGEVTMKVAYQNGEVLKYAPEYDECQRIATEYNLPIKEVYQIIIDSYRSSHKKV
ncbi:uncharacterized protein DUF111 [Orenia metallireducens]|uniref:TIGR00299 family protein n=1 Tax=Orenia metallireducens TaxID=1413210 RepID=A0A285GCW8_9FIRM|nr:nickel insertion protein [Orenia metallireducens]PRX19177.1 uncharacterized protein DUF111 [Orenia metallireducens]SNY21258.1 Protein of unknown function DUF111 [Orenia metallireducens]